MGTAKKFYFYVLLCQDQTLYAGYTTNLQQRLATHNAAKGAKYTRPQSRRPAQLIYAEYWPSRSEAMRAEALFKQLSRAQKEVYLKARGQESLQGTNFVLVNGSHYATAILEGGADESI